MPGLIEETISQDTEMTVVEEKKSKKSKKTKKENEADESITEDVKPKKRSKKNGTLKETNLDATVEDEVKEKVKKSETDLNETAESEEVSKKEKKKSKKSKKEKSSEEVVHVPITRSMDGPSTDETPTKSPLKTKKKFEKRQKGGKSATEESDDVEMSDDTKKTKKAKKRKSEDTPSKTEETSSKKKKTENGYVPIDESKITAMDGTEESVAEKEGNFENFAIPPKIRQKLEARGVKYLFPVQYKSFNQIIEGKDVIARARTGTGKTFSFAIPLVCKLESTADKNKGRRPPRVLVLTPTRELCTQVCNDFKCLGTTIRCQAVYGGVGYDTQRRAFREGFDILVGTPGRVNDFIEQGTFDVTKLEYVILDEVDQMLDMGFAPQVDKILTNAYDSSKPESRPQTMLFSATVPEWVKSTANKYMKDDAEWIDLIGKDRVKTATTVEHLAIRCDWHQRNIVIGDLIQIYSGNHGRAIVFCETKRHCDELSTDPAIKQDVHVMHGDIQQSKRELVLKKFREGIYRVLVTTNVAARGLDIPEVDLVIQKELPQDVDSYIHRSGRTGRAGRCGIAACLYSNQDERDLVNLERRAGITFKRQGIPSNELIVKAASDDAVRTLQAVDEEARSMFYDSAESILESMTPKEAIAAALAALTGNTKMQQKSLLTGRSGFTTYVLEAMSEKNNSGFAISCLRNALGQDIMSKIGKVQMSKCKKQFLFDVPNDAVKTIKENWVDTKWEFLVEATEVPELEQSVQSSSGGGSRPYGGKRNYGSGGSRGGARGRGFRHGTFKRGGNFGRSGGNTRKRFN